MADTGSNSSTGSSPHSGTGNSSGHQKQKILVAMSGGVDSSVAAAMLVEQGHEVVGVFMRLGSPGDTLDELMPADEVCDASKIKIGKQGCCSINDAADARLVAAELGIPFYVCNFKKDFGRIIDYFVDEYASGRTPNPCVRCNDWLKFGKLHEYAEQIGAGAVASGHYARVEERAGPDGVIRRALLRGVDEDKDQSYVLFGVPPEKLGSMMLPVGGFQKSEIREMARERDLPVFDKPDSQEICFVPDNDYAGLVERKRPDLASEGEIIGPGGEVLGTHGGQHRFTVGQRRGIGVALGHPLYVIEKRPADNTVRVGTREDLVSRWATAGEANWVGFDPSKAAAGFEALVQYRYNSPAVPGRVWVEPDGGEAGGGSTPSGRTGRFRVGFDADQHAVAPGQAMVVYDRDEPARVLGGGWIQEAGPQQAGSQQAGSQGAEQANGGDA